MAIFRRRRADEPPVIADRCWNDPELDALADRLERPGESEARVRRAIQALAAARADAERQSCVAWVAADRLTDALEALTARAAVPTGDDAADADVKALLAATLVRRAWEVRGSGRADTVGRDAFEVFFGILAEADEAGAEAVKLQPGHPVAGVARLTSARGLQLPMEEHWARFDETRAVHPRLWGAYRAQLQSVCEKWYGSHAALMQFAHETARSAGVGDPTGALLAEAWAELDLEGEDGRSIGADRRADQRIVAEAADRWVAGGEAALAHPAALAAHQFIGWFLADDRERAHFHLSRTGGRMSGSPWYYRRNPERAYRSAMRAAGVAGW